MARANLSCADCAKGDEPRVIDIDGVLSSISGEPGELAHSYSDYWWICVGAYTHESALTEISRLIDMEPDAESPNGNKLIALTEAVQEYEKPIRKRLMILSPDVEQ